MLVLDAISSWNIFIGGWIVEEMMFSVDERRSLRRRPLHPGLAARVHHAVCA
jgi:hypothetical protein